MNARDRDLARRMLAGEERAFDEFFDGYFAGIFRFAMARLNRDADAAEEIAQATLCKAISKLQTYRGEAALFTWLCTFCRHEISAFCKRTMRQPTSAGLIEENPETKAALESLWVLAADGPEDSLRRKELARLVHVTLDSLPARYADVLEWKYIDGAPIKEIAARLRLSPKAAESTLTRARQAFRDGFSTLAGAAGPCEEWGRT